MTTPIRLSVQKDGHIILRIGEATVEILAEGALVVTAYLPTDTRPLVEYSSAPEPKPMLKLRPTQAVPAFTEPQPKPVVIVPSAPVYLPPPTVVVKLSKKDRVAEYGRLIVRKKDKLRPELLLRLMDRAVRIAGPVFTPVDAMAPIAPQQELFFAELQQWRATLSDYRPRKTPKRFRLAPLVMGKEAPSSHTIHGYVYHRIKNLNVPNSPEKLALRYREYNAAMGTNHPIPGNVSLIDAFEHLRGLVHSWWIKQCDAAIKEAAKAAIRQRNIADDRKQMRDMFADTKGAK